MAYQFRNCMRPPDHREPCQIVEWGLQDSKTYPLAYLALGKGMAKTPLTWLHPWLTLTSLKWILRPHVVTGKGRRKPCNWAQATPEGHMFLFSHLLKSCRWGTGGQRQSIPHDSCISSNLNKLGLLHDLQQEKRRDTCLPCYAEVCVGDPLGSWHMELPIIHGVSTHTERARIASSPSRCAPGVDKW